MECVVFALLLTWHAIWLIVAVLESLATCQSLRWFFSLYDYAICAIKAISISCHLAQSIRKQELFVAFLQNPPDARCSDIWFQSFDWSIDAVVVENSIPRTTLRFLLASLAAVGRLGETASFFFLWNIWGIISVPYTNPRGNRFAPISKAISRETGQASNPSHHTCIRLSSVQDETAHRKNYFCLKTSWDCDPS